MQQKSRKGARRRRATQQADAGIPRAFGSGDIIVKRMTFCGTTTTLTSTGGGAIGITTLASDPTVGPAFEWASFSARYQQFRVRAQRIIGKALNPVNTTGLVHSVLFRAEYIGASGPSTVPQLLADEKAQICATSKDFTDLVTWERNPNAKLWNPTSAGVPSANLMNWVCATFASTALTASTKYYQIVQEFEVELRGAQ